MWTQTVHFPISFNMPQLATWDYPHYPIIYSFSPFFFFFFWCVKYRYKEGKISFWHADSLLNCTIQTDIRI